MYDAIPTAVKAKSTIKIYETPRLRAGTALDFPKEIIVRTRPRDPGGGHDTSNKSYQAQLGDDTYHVEHELEQYKLHPSTLIGRTTEPFTQAVQEPNLVISI